METLNMFAYSRAALLIALRNTKENTWDERIEGFPNTIRWNAGHVYVTAEEYLNKADHHYDIVHPKWFDFFLDGTSPFDWEQEPPTVEEILGALKKQGERIVEFFNGKLDIAASETVDIRYLKLDTVDAALQFVTWHDGIHLGIIKSMQYVMN
ncbi:DinB family protein [Siminovitchia terrae]|uniref:DinB family protein n=1 Tax=Siminovitchia terrae TaxID=1914933 RepID=UPI0028A8BA48|nr:DinB family protein [Siminovitchia terrae]